MLPVRLRHFAAIETASFCARQRNLSDLANVQADLGANQERQGLVVQLNLLAASRRWRLESSLSVTADRTPVLRSRDTIFSLQVQSVRRVRQVAAVGGQKRPGSVHSLRRRRPCARRYRRRSSRARHTSSRPGRRRSDRRTPRRERSASRRGTSSARSPQAATTARWFSGCPRPAHHANHDQALIVQCGVDDRGAVGRRVAVRRVLVPDQDFVVGAVDVDDVDGAELAVFVGRGVQQTPTVGRPAQGTSSWSSVSVTRGSALPSALTTYTSPGPSATVEAANAIRVPSGDQRPNPSKPPDEVSWVGSLPSALASHRS